MKPCKPGFERNVTTKRCRKIKNSAAPKPTTPNAVMAQPQRRSQGLHETSFFGKSRAQVNQARILFQEMIDNYINDNGVPSDISDIFEYIKTFNTRSVNGNTHVMRLKQDPAFIFLVKTVRTENQNADSLVREFEVLKHLNALQERTPNFPVALGLFNCYSISKSNGALPKNFCKGGAKSQNMTMMVTEYIPEARSLNEFIGKATPEQIRSIFLQIYYTLLIAQYYQQFTHYDTHAGNFLVRKIDQTSLQYKLPNNETRKISTDVLVTIIDFGRAYSNAIYKDFDKLTHIYQESSIRDINGVLRKAYLRSSYRPFEYNGYKAELDSSVFHPTIDLFRLLMFIVTYKYMFSVSEEVLDAMEDLIRQMRLNPMQYPTLNLKQ